MRSNRKIIMEAMRRGGQLQARKLEWAKRVPSFLFEARLLLIPCFAAAAYAPVSHSTGMWSLVAAHSIAATILVENGNVGGYVLCGVASFVAGMAIALILLKKRRGRKG